MFSIIDAVLDETPDPAKLTPNTFVLGKNIGSGSFEKGIIERKDETKYWIKTKSDIWANDLNDVRLYKSPEFCLLWAKCIKSLLANSNIERLYRLEGVQ